MPGPTPHWSHQVKLEATAICASESRAFVSHWLVEHRLLYLVDPVRLVASELATNALIHGQSAFIVTLSQPDGCVRLSVQDEAGSVPVHRVAGLMDTHGRGLQIVELMSHQWGIDMDTGGYKSVWATFALRTRPGS